MKFCRWILSPWNHDEESFSLACAHFMMWKNGPHWACRLTHHRRYFSFAGSVDFVDPFNLDRICVPPPCSIETFERCQSGAVNNSTSWPEKWKSPVADFHLKKLEMVLWLLYFYFGTSRLKFCVRQSRAEKGLQNSIMTKGRVGWGRWQWMMTVNGS